MSSEKFVRFETDGKITVKGEVNYGFAVCLRIFGKGSLESQSIF